MSIIYEVVPHDTLRNGATDENRTRLVLLDKEAAIPNASGRIYSEYISHLLSYKARWES